MEKKKLKSNIEQKILNIMCLTMYDQNFFVITKFIFKIKILSYMKKNGLIPEIMDREGFIVFYP